MVWPTLGSTTAKEQNRTVGTRGLSRLSDQGRMVAILEGRSNPFCERAIVGLRTTFYTVMCDIPLLKGELTVLG